MEIPRKLHFCRNAGRYRLPHFPIEYFLVFQSLRFCGTESWLLWKNATWEEMQRMNTWISDLPRLHCRKPSNGCLWSTDAMERSQRFAMCVHIMKQNVSTLDNTCPLSCAFSGITWGPNTPYIPLSHRHFQARLGRSGLSTATGQLQTRSSFLECDWGFQARSGESDVTLAQPSNGTEGDNFN